MAKAFATITVKLSEIEEFKIFIESLEQIREKVEDSDISESTGYKRIIKEFQKFKDIIIEKHSND